MRTGSDRKRRYRARRATSRDDEPERRVFAGAEWPRASRRARVLAAALSIAIAAIILAVVSLVWHRAAPPPRPLPTSVEVKLVPTPPVPRPSR